MAFATSWLQRQRKSDLVDIADQVGLKDYSHFKKSDLEVALEDYLRANHTRLSKLSLLDEFYARLGWDAATSPIKSPIKGESISLNPSEDVKKARSRRTTQARDDIRPANVTSQPILTRIPARASITDSIPLPPSPSQLVDTIDFQTERLKQRTSSVISSLPIRDYLNALRTNLSSITAISLLLVGIEAYGLRSIVLPGRYLLTVPSLSLLGFRTSAVAVNIPDLFALLTGAFWGPTSLWLMTSVLVPGAAAWMFNIANAGADYDPLTFHVSRGLLAYMIYGRGVRLGGWISGASTGAVEDGVPGGWWGMVLGAGVGGLMAFWEAVVRR